LFTVEQQEPFNRAWFQSH